MMTCNHFDMLSYFVGPMAWKRKFIIHLNYFFLFYTTNHLSLVLHFEKMVKSFNIKISF